MAALAADLIGIARAHESPDDFARAAGEMVQEFYTADAARRFRIRAKLVRELGEQRTTQLLPRLVRGRRLGQPKLEAQEPPAIEEPREQAAEPRPLVICGDDASRLAFLLPALAGRPFRIELR